MSPSTLRPIIPGLLSNKLPIPAIQLNLQPSSNSLPAVSSTDTVGQAGPCDTLNIINRIRMAASRLKPSVPEATALDTLACFSGDPTLEVGDNDPWEAVNRTLHDGLGYGATVEDLVKIIRRGPYGILGFTNWVESCIRILKIDGALMEGRLQRVLEAVKQL